MTDQELHELEQKALLGDRDAVIRLVSLERKLRAAIKRALDSRWGDGAITGVNSGRLYQAYADAMEEE